MRVVFVHGACVRDGSWWWHRTAELLAERDVASEAPVLPSCGETGKVPDAQGPGLVEDVAAVREVLAAGDEPTVVVAHSYGGIVTAEAAAGVGAVRHLLLVSSYLPEVGQSLSSFGGEEPAPFATGIPPGKAYEWANRSSAREVAGPARAGAASTTVCGVMDRLPADNLKLRQVEEAFALLPERYLGGEEDRHATVEIRLSDLGRTWQIELRGHRCKVRPSPRGRPDVTISTDAATWLELREGRLSGLDAFRQRRLWARGDLDVAVGFEGLFRLPDERPPLLRIHDVRVRGARISCLTAGRGPEHAILIHGLGGAKSSFYETVAALSPDHTVHAIDLPGFGSSSKPLGSYDPGFFAHHVLRLMDAMAIDRADLVGNSMGGRVALEVGLRAPSRVRTLSLLAPSMAFRRGRELVPLARILRPELGALPAVFGARQVRDGFWRMIARPDRVDPALADIAADEFLRTHRSPAARVAFYAAARQIYLEAPHGPHGFWTRLGQLRPPALFVWGSEDPLVPARFSRHVAAVLPEATQVILPECGHIPQIELPEETHGLVREFINSGGARPSSEPVDLARSA